MDRRIDSEQTSVVIDEMAIVDVFTRLIFDPETVLDATELLIVECLQHTEPSLDHASRQELSEYLRVLAVDEMIAVVAKIKQVVQQRHGVVGSITGATNPHLHH